MILFIISGFIVVCRELKKLLVKKYGTITGIQSLNIRKLLLNLRKLTIEMMSIALYNKNSMSKVLMMRFSC